MRKSIYKIAVSGLVLLLVILSAKKFYAGTLAADVPFKDTKMVRIPEGYYKPFYKTEGIDSVKINAFDMDAYPVTNAQFLAFVKANPKWAKSAVTATFADKGYLKSWKDDLDIGDTSLVNRPVTNVSWFAALAYSKWLGKRLPTIYEWEYAATADLVWPKKATGKEKNKIILKWYGKPNPAQFPKVGTVNKNAFGVYDMYGSIWEWVQDFTSVVVANDARGGLDPGIFCGSGAFGTLNPLDYATFMRFAFRNSLKAPYTVENLGFRCVKDIKK
ncbi:MAG: formylglycine-generating enzyme family protein [Bacteroidia bacterium]